KDLETIEKRLDKLKKQAKTAEKEALRNVATAEKIKMHLEGGAPARSIKLEEDEMEVLKDMLLLTAKPILYVCNVDEDAVHEGNEHTEAFKTAVAGENAEIIYISAGIEADIA